MQVNSRSIFDLRPKSRAQVVFIPVVIVGSIAAIVILAWATIGWHPHPLSVAAIVFLSLVSVAALMLLLRERFDRGEATSALENVQARVGGIVESAMDAIISIDESQRIVQFNAAAEKVFLWPRRAVIGESIEKLIPGRFRDAHAEHVKRFGETSVTSRTMGVQRVISGLRADGTEFPIEASISQHNEDGRKIFTVILRDVSKRLEAESSLAQSESRLRAILDSAMDAIITVDESQRIVLFNKAAEIVFRCTRDDAIGAQLSWFIPPRYRDQHGEHIKRFGEGGATSRRMGGAARIVMGVRRNGEEFPIEASISQTIESNQRFYTVILRDVTERVAADQALARSRDEVRNLSLAANNAREEEKRRISRELHDELGQSLTALRMDVESLKPFATDNPDLEQKLGAMRNLLDDTVAAARRISRDLRPMMLDDLGLTSAAEWLVQNFTSRSDIECHIDIDAEHDLDVPDPYATALFRVLQESLTNVAKHSGATRVDVALMRVGDEAIVTVRDNGRGLQPESLKKIGSFGITGLRERAYLLGGTFSIDSKPGAGTTVEFRVPMPPTAPAAPAEGGEP